MKNRVMTGTLRACIFIVLIFISNVSFGQCITTNAQVPTAAINLPFWGSNFSFSNPGDVVSANGSTSASALLSLLSGKTQYLVVTGFNLSIPNNAVICGVEAQVQQSATGISVLSWVQDNAVLLVKNGTPLGNNKASNALWNSWPVTETYGGTTDKWGVQLTPADVNSSNFGIALSVSINGLLSAIPSASVSNINLKVSYMTPLPVHLISFDAVWNNNQPNIRWSIADQERNTLYTVQRTTDGAHWENIYATRGNEDISGEKTYNYTDIHPFQGPCYYRLQITQPNGQFIYSNIAYHLNKSAGNDIICYPNPANNFITVSMPESEGNITVSDQNGATIRLPVLYKDATTCRLNISSLKPGMYFIQSGKQVFRFLKI